MLVLGVGPAPLFLEHWQVLARTVGTASRYLGPHARGTVSKRFGGFPVELDASVGRAVEVALSLQRETELQFARFCIDLPEPRRGQRTQPIERLQGRRQIGTWGQSGAEL